jgi:hypothetical protein
MTGAVTLDLPAARPSTAAAEPGLPVAGSDGGSWLTSLDPQGGVTLAPSTATDDHAAGSSSAEPIDVAVLDRAGARTGGGPMPSPSPSGPVPNGSTAAGAVPIEVEVEVEPAEPTAIRIPAIALDVDLVGVGLLDDGAMEIADFGLAGWYTLGPRPGARGPSVIAGHVDSYRGPDVFFRLRELVPGDEVHVDRADGSTATFVVDGLEQHPKDQLPSGRIWARTDERLLWLITCGGEFDRDSRSYRDNIIVRSTHQEPSNPQRAS